MTTVVIHNVESGEIIDRDMTTAELTQHKKDVELGKAELQAKKDKAEAKASAEAKLAALGLTADEIAALIS
jgi:hypothetical protein